MSKRRCEKEFLLHHLQPTTWESEDTFASVFCDVVSEYTSKLIYETPVKVEEVSGDLTSQWGKKFFLYFSTQIEKNRKKNRKIFFLKKVDFWKKNRSLARILALKWPLKARDIFFRPWCQYKSCIYWSSLSKYGKWAKSNEANSRNWTKTPFWARFGHVWPDLGPGHFFFKNPTSSLF